MIKAIRESFEIILFFSLTFFLYLIFIVTIPIFRDLHGLLVMTDLPELSRSGMIKELLSGSAAVCVVLGVLMLEAVPTFTPVMMANFWAVTYFYLWGNCLYALIVESQSLKFFAVFGLGLGFIYLFFMVLSFLGFHGEKAQDRPVWKMRMMNYWIWGWMGFYLGLSMLLAVDSFKYMDDRWVLAFGAMVLCFLNYLICLFLRKSLDREVKRFSRVGRAFFLSWFGVLTLGWLIAGWVR